jgi:inward rectifier potassium channel
MSDDSIERPPKRARGITVRVGRREVTKVGAKRYDFTDLQHEAMKLTWPSFFGLVVVFYLVMNALFAVAYMAYPDTIGNARDASFADAYFFSFETMTTMGFGDMRPGTPYGRLVATVEVFTGLLAFTILAGFIFARLSRPSARVLFSRTMVIGSFNGKPTLFLRAANERNNLILEASAQLAFVRNESTVEGYAYRRFYDLDLVRSRSPAFALTWTIMHSIDDKSPLFGLSASDLSDSDASIVATITGLDETMGQSIHARHEYFAANVLYDHRFVDILVETPDSGTILDLSRFHHIERITPEADAAPH